MNECRRDAASRTDRAKVARLTGLALVGVCCLAAGYGALVASGWTTGAIFRDAGMGSWRLWFETALVWMCLWVWLWSALEFRFAALRSRTIDWRVALVAWSAPVLVGAWLTLAAPSASKPPAGLAVPREPRWLEGFLWVGDRLGLLAGLMTLMGLVLGRRAAKRFLRSTTGQRCASCGYDLTGNVSGRCPECGREIRASRETRPQATG